MRNEISCDIIVAFSFTSEAHLDLSLRANSNVSCIREAAVQVRRESPPRPKIYSWTAAFVLHASFSVSKAGIGA